MNRREALRTVGAGSALGLTGALILTTTSCDPNDAPAATADDPMTKILHEYRRLDDVYGRMALADDDEAATAFQAQHVDPVRDRIVNERPPVTTEDGARLALRTALTHGVFICPFTHALVRQTLAYLDGRAA